MKKKWWKKKEKLRSKKKRENEKRENKKSEQDEVILEKEEMKLQIENYLVNSSFPIITNSLLHEPSQQFEPLQLIQILS